jgi:uncharacterized protein (TIGR03435 family)
LDPTGTGRISLGFFRERSEQLTTQLLRWFHTKAERTPLPGAGFSPNMAERLKLVRRRESKELPVYALLIATNGPKLQAAKNQPREPPGANPVGSKKMRSNFRGMMMMRPGQIEGHSTPVSFLAQTLSQQLDRMVVDKTGLTGLYDFTLSWQPEERQGRCCPYRTHR